MCWSNTSVSALGGHTGLVATEAPSGLVLEPELIDEAEERRLLDGFAALDFQPVVIRGQTSLRTAAHFGLRYGYENRRLTPGDPLPPLLEPLRRRAAELAGVEPERWSRRSSSATRRARRSAGTATRRRSTGSSGSRSSAAPASASGAGRCGAGRRGRWRRRLARRTSSPARRAPTGSTRSRRRRSSATRSPSGICARDRGAFVGARAAPLRLAGGRGRGDDTDREGARGRSRRHAGARGIRRRARSTVDDGRAAAARRAHRSPTRRAGS